jgi:hypothetical protein
MNITATRMLKYPMRKNRISEGARTKDYNVSSDMIITCAYGAIAFQPGPQGEFGGYDAAGR